MKNAITIRINQYGTNQTIDVTFIGDSSPNGFTDFRIVDAFTKQIVPGNTGWSRIK